MSVEFFEAHCKKCETVRLLQSQNKQLEKELTLTKAINDGFIEEVKQLRTEIKNKDLAWSLLKAERAGDKKYISIANEEITGLLEMWQELQERIDMAIADLPECPDSAKECLQSTG